MPRDRVRPSRWARTLSWGIALLACAYLGLIHWPGRPYLVDLAADFVLHFGALFLVLGGGCLLLRVYVPAALTLAAACGVLLGCLTAVSNPDKAAPADGHTIIKVIHYNCFGQATLNDEAFMKWVRDQNPDIISLVDPPIGLPVAQPWLVRKYPYRVEPSPGALWDVILLSRFPMELAKLRQDNDPAIVFSFLARRGVLLHITGAPDVLWSAMHPPSPRTRLHWRDAIDVVRRDAPLIAEYLAARRGPVLITGDFNSTPGGRAFQEFRAISGLTPWGRVWPAGTWPSSLGPMLGVPIDRIWTSPDIVCRSWHVGPRFQSDHLPLVAELVLPPATGPGAASPHPGAREPAPLLPNPHP